MAYAHGGPLNGALPATNGGSEIAYTIASRYAYANVTPGRIGEWSPHGQNLYDGRNVCAPNGARRSMPRTSHHEGAQQQATGRCSAAPIDHTVLGKLLSEDQEAVSLVLRQFRASCPGDASALGAALSRNDSKEASRWAHRLKGACQLVGAPLLTRACERAEAAIRAADARLAATAVSDIDCEAERISGYLDAWLKTAARSERA